jgi:hypothetical protein
MKVWNDDGTLKCDNGK